MQSVECFPLKDTNWLQGKKLSAAQPHFDATWKKFQEAIDVLPEEDKGKKLKPIQVSIQLRP